MIRRKIHLTVRPTNFEDDTGEKSERKAKDVRLNKFKSKNEHKAVVIQTKSLNVWLKEKVLYNMTGDFLFTCHMGVTCLN